MHAAAPGEQIGEFLFVGAQSIDAEDAILREQWGAGAAPVETNKQHRRLIGDRAHRGCSKTGLAGYSRGSDDVHRGAETAHGLAEYERLDARNRARSDRRESAIHRIIGALIDPAHGCILLQSAY